MREIPSIRENTDQMTESKSFTHPWRTPVPYLFGGLAAMLGLIALALLLLACSYWKFSRQIDDEGGDGEKQNESGEKVEAKVYEEKILVIMAGQDKPTFLATPVEAKSTCVNCGEIVVITEEKEGQNGESRFTDGSSSSSDDEKNH